MYLRSRLFTETNVTEIAFLGPEAQSDNSIDLSRSLLRACTGIEIIGVISLEMAQYLYGYFRKGGLEFLRFVAPKLAAPICAIV